MTFSSTVIDPTNTSGSYLDNSGTILAAVSFGPTRTGPYTYNAPTQASNPDNAPTLNGIAFSSSAGSTTPSGTYFSVSQSGGSNALGYDAGRFSNISSSNQSLYGLAYDVLRTGSNDGRMVLDLTNLTVGGQYQLQLIFSTLNSADNPAGNMADRSVQIAAGVFTANGNNQTGTGSDGTSDKYSYGPSTGAIVVTADFTADATTQSLSLLSNTTGGNSRVSLAGIVITAVPEPSSAGLAAAGLLGLALRRSRRKGC